MGEATQSSLSGAQETHDVQSRFIADNMRRIFLQIYRVVGNVDDAQDLTQETFIKALQRQDQLKDEAAVAPRHPAQPGAQRGDQQQLHKVVDEQPEEAIDVPLHEDRVIPGHGAGQRTASRGERQAAWIVRMDHHPHRPSDLASRAA